MRTIRRINIQGIAAGLALLGSGSIVAHHNPGFYFDMTTQAVHENVTVVSFTVANPHGRLVYRMRDTDGSEREWIAELPAVNMMRRFGVTSDLISPGDVLTLTGNPGQNGSTMLRVTHALLPNGRVATFYAPQASGEPPAAFGN